MPACMLPRDRIGIEHADAVFIAAISFGTLVMSGRGASGFLNSPISARPSGVKSLAPSDSTMVPIRSMGSITTSAAGVLVRMSFMMVPMPVHLDGHLHAGLFLKGGGDLASGRNWRSPRG